MTCWSVQRRSTDYVDGRLRKGELSRVEAHVAECRECAQQVQEIHDIRATLHQLRPVKAPSELRLRLQVEASRERKALMETNGSRFLRLWNSWAFRLDELMRPITIPATGGLFSSIVLFGALAFTIGTTTRGVTYEVPVMYAERGDANLVPVELQSSVVLTLSVNGNGRIIDYAVLDNAGSFSGDASKLQYNNISVPEIPNALRLAMPTSSDIRISFTPIIFRQ
ncbi:MAG TPA: zf-HC2 domain-containing protein [Bryobacteraceae bacterium]